MAGTSPAMTVMERLRQFRNFGSRVVMPALVAGIHVLVLFESKSWMAGTSPAMTVGRTGYVSSGISAVQGQAARPAVRLFLPAPLAP